MGRLFGTDGIRGVAGKELNIDLAVKCGRALGTVGCAGAQAGAVNPEKGYQATITSSMQGETVALLGGAIGDFAAN